MYQVGADGRSAPELLLSQRFAVYPSSWSPDGRLLAYHEENPSAGLDVGVWSRESGPAAVVQSAFLETNATFSPDGQWLAYSSNETGRTEVYVAPYPPGAQRWRVSAGGGREPVWSPDGRALFYRNLPGNQLLRADIDGTAGTLVAGRPHVVLDGAYADVLGGTGANYDIAPDGRRFVMVKRDRERPPKHIHVILRWNGEVIPDTTEGT